MKTSPKSNGPPGLDARTAALATRPWDRLHDRALGRARSVPTMLSPQEQRLYYWLAAFWAEGAGDVVDLGSFAGGSTARLTEGLAAAGLDGTVHAFDRFTAGEDVKQSILYRQGVEPFDGEDILPLAQNLLEPWQGRVVFHPGEIHRMGWSGAPIEILVMDASKSADTMDQMAATFLPHLLPGRSLLVQQDFLHWSQPWVPVQMERLAQCFLPLVHVERDTLVYLCLRPPTAGELAESRTHDLSDRQLLRALEAAREQYESWGLAVRLDDMIAGLRANPGKRRAHQFKRP